jgi:predicted DNA-binding transcriptional regulator YafY
MKKTMNLKRGKLILLAAIAMFATLHAGAQGQHPAYLHALSNLHAAHWQQGRDEAAAVGAIDAAVAEIKKASIDDHKDMNDHSGVQDIPDHGGRLQNALRLLRATRADVAQKEDDRFARGLKARALLHIDDAIKATQNALAAVAVVAPPPPHANQHPAYLKALSDLRAARWLIDHRTGNWQQSKDETAAVGAIDAAIAEIHKAAIDDHKNVNDHTGVQEIPDHGGRLRKALEILRASRADLNQREDNGFAQGLKARALQHIDNAIKATQAAMTAGGFR